MLNEAQHRGVHSPGHALISACPGSGKTTVLSRRAAHLLSSDPAAVLVAVTFTNDAAEELAQRIGKLCQGAEQRIIAGTFHKLAKTQLLQAGRRFKLASEAQASAFRRRAAGDVESLDLTPDEIASSIETQKAQGAAGSALSDDDPRAIARARYQQALETHGLLDFQDLLLQAVEGMGIGTVKPLQAKYLLVDEVQDADPVQWAWILAHANAGLLVTTVGDDDQAIYGWRNASGFAGMQQFVSATQADHIQLDITYRCAPEILASAGKLIEHNTSRVPKSLRTANTTVGRVRVAVASSRKDEAIKVAEAIAETGNPEGWAVLGRSNALIDGVEQALNVSKIPCRRIGGKSFWEQPGPEMYLAVLAALARRDMLSVSMLLGKSHVPERVLDSVSRQVNAKRPGSLTRFLALAPEAFDKHPALTALQEKVRLWCDMDEAGSIGTLVHSVAVWMETHIDKRTLRMSLESCATTVAKLEFGTLAQRVKALQKDREQNGGGVTLMTLHASKGLEFDRVWMVACERGVLPHKSSDVAEERRLAYVGMTRARQELVMSYSLAEKTSPSSFLWEAGLLE